MKTQIFPYFLFGSVSLAITLGVLSPAIAVETCSNANARSTTAIAQRTKAGNIVNIAVLSWLEHSRSGEGERLKGKGERSEDFFLFPLPLLLFPSERFLVSHSIENRYIAASNSSFTTLVQAVQAAGLVETLSGNGPFTVFAPTNEAFAALPPGTLEDLLKPENRDTLRQILTYHVVSGAVESGDIQPGNVATVEGSPVRLNVTDGRIKVNDATVRTADIRASNGVIHVIDRVILPPGL